MRRSCGGPCLRLGKKARKVSIASGSTFEETSSVVDKLYDGGHVEVVEDVVKET